MTRRGFIALTTLLSGAVAAFPALAQAQEPAPAPAPPRPRSPGEIAARSRLLAQKNEDCKRQAREQNLGFLKRRQFIRACVKNPGP
jgi:hypothetical protein